MNQHLPMDGLCKTLTLKNHNMHGVQYKRWSVPRPPFTIKSIPSIIKPIQTCQGSSLLTMLQQSHLQIAPSNLHNHILQLGLSILS